MTIVAVIPDHSDMFGIDHIYVHGADIADPHNSTDVTWNESVTPPQPVFVISVDPSEDDGPYRATLESWGLTITGTDGKGNWTLRQVRPL